jgi:hypothetical protein
MWKRRIIRSGEKVEDDKNCRRPKCGNAGSFEASKIWKRRRTWKRPKCGNAGSFGSGQNVKAQYQRKWTKRGRGG